MEKNIQTEKQSNFRLLGNIKTVAFIPDNNAHILCTTMITELFYNLHE
jgi:hypothetical protein